MENYNIVCSNDTLGFIQMDFSGNPCLRTYALYDECQKRYDLWVFDHKWGSKQEHYPAVVFDRAENRNEAASKLRRVLDNSDLLKSKLQQNKLHKND